MRSPKAGGWFRPRGYSHFDHPMSFEKAEKLATSSAMVARHPFLPLISFTDVKRQFRTDKSDPTIPRKLRKRIVKIKTRDLRYASHRDSAILAFYAHQLQRQYELSLKSHNLDNCVIGYRAGLGSNIDLAASAFAEISERGNVTALCFDIENFFPSIRHDILKSALCEILGVSALPDDWYNVFKNVCKYSHIELKKLAHLEGFDSECPPFPLVKDIAATIERCRRAKIVVKNKSAFDIPQGTPISAVFANAAMLAFDRNLQSWAAQCGASYRRYSDDILLLVPPDRENQAAKFVETEATKIGLTINSAKTEISRFVRITGIQAADVPVTYLGFTFDGKSVSLRSRTLSRYYRRMTYATRSTARCAGKAGQLPSNAFKRALIRDFTHLGHRNFYSYARKANSKFVNSIIKKQLKRHFSILLRKLNNLGR